MPNELLFPMTRSYLVELLGCSYGKDIKGRSAPKKKYRYISSAKCLHVVTDMLSIRTISEG